MDELDIFSTTRRTVQGIAALISRQFINQLVTLVAAFVISLYLSPNEFGLYTIVVAIQRVISFFTDFGFGAALIQKKEEINQDDIKTTFTVQVVTTFLIFLTIFAFSDTVALAFNLTESAKWLLIVLVFTIFLSSFKTIPAVLLERKIQFHKLVIPQIVESISFNLLLIILLMSGYDIASYTWAFFLSGIISVPIYYYISPWKMEFGIVRSSLVHLKFGAQFQAKNILATIKDDFITLFLSRVLSFTEIGYIGFAQRWAFFVFRFVVDSVTKVTFSTYSRLQDSKEHLEKAIEKSLFFVACAMFPALAGIMLIFPYIISLVPRLHKWEPAILSLMFFCLNAAISSLSAILVNVLDSTGRVKKTLQLMVLWTLLVWVLTPVAIYLYGYNGVAIASFLVTLTIFYTVLLVKKFVHFNFWKSIYKPLLATSVMSILVYALSKFLVHDILTLVFVILLGGVAYGTSLFLFAKKQLQGDLQAIRMKNHE